MIDDKRTFINPRTDKSGHRFASSNVHQIEPLWFMIGQKFRTTVPVALPLTSVKDAALPVLRLNDRRVTRSCAHKS